MQLRVTVTNSGTVHPGAEVAPSRRVVGWVT